MGESICEKCLHRFHAEEFGKTAFLTREEAEAALAERMKKDDRN